MDAVLLTLSAAANVPNCDLEKAVMTQIVFILSAPRFILARYAYCRACAPFNRFY